MSAEILEPVDTCGCGDIGYLTTRTLPMDLAHGVGTIHHVPVYHCQNLDCQAYTLPEQVSRRLEDIAETMEEHHLAELSFSWSDNSSAPTASPSASLDPLKQAQAVESIIQAFTLQMVNRDYEDSKVILVAPGQAVLFQSLADHTEYFSLVYEPEHSPESVWFSFSKFYADDPVESFEDFTAIQEEGGLKELAVLKLEEIEDTLTEEFGEIV